MNGHSDIHCGCSDYFTELCALSTTGSLNEQERYLLEDHLKSCASCGALLAEYQSLASEGMAKLGAVRPLVAGGHTQEPWGRDQAKSRLLARLASPDNGRPAQQPELAATPAKARWRDFLRLPRAVPLLHTAAVLIAAVLVAYQFGFKHGSDRTASLLPPLENAATSLEQRLAKVQAHRDDLDAKLAQNSQSIATLEERASRAEREVAQLEELKAGLESRSQALVAQNQDQSATLATLAAERDSLQQRLRDSESVLRSVRQELDAVRDERQRLLLRTANYQTQVNRLTARLREREETYRRQEQLLAHDRDVRELMGARQLYIADVFDIDSRGNARKPFGRIFYTTGKSLIFYAFDLEQQPGYRDAKAFQAWGRPASSGATPVSLGIFYLDNETNHRWALKFDDPAVLQEISAVFVTLEPEGGSQKPTNKPFLLAYLHAASPNHP